LPELYLRDIVDSEGRFARCGFRQGIETVLHFPGSFCFITIAHAVRRHARGMAALLSLLGIALLLSACGQRRTPSAGPCETPPPLPYSEDLARSLDARLSPLYLGQSNEFAIRTTSQELTSWVTYSTIRWPEIPIKNAVVWFSPEQVHFSGTIWRILPFAFSVKVRARVWLSGRTPQVVVEDACIGRSALPGWLKRLIQRVINETIMDAGSLFQCDELRLSDGELYVKGMIK